ncbi:hypothetical protein AVEN_114007-1, partial [Araneus ventricosus]
YGTRCIRNENNLFQHPVRLLTRHLELKFEPPIGNYGADLNEQDDNHEVQRTTDWPVQ